MEADSNILITSTEEWGTVAKRPERKKSEVANTFCVVASDLLLGRVAYLRNQTIHSSHAAAGSFLWRFSD